MKKFRLVLMLFYVLLSTIAKCQKNTLKIDSIHFSKVCFGGLCLGDSISKMYKIYEKPTKVEYFDGKGEVSDVNIPLNTYYFINKGKIIIIEEQLIPNMKGKIYNFPKNNRYNLTNQINIGSDISKIGLIFPNSLIIAQKRKEITKEGNGYLVVGVFGNLNRFEGISSIIINLKKGKVLNIYSQEEY